MAARTRRVVLLEPDVWRFQGIARYLAENAGIEIIGEPRSERLLDAAARKLDIAVDAVMLAQKLIDDYGQEIIDRLKSAHRDTPILVYGHSHSVESTASLLARGATGYFLLSSPQRQLVDALNTVCAGRIWASRESVFLAARAAVASASLGGAPSEDQMLLALLREGLSNKEIASRLGVAEVTVKARLSRMYRRYDVGSRLQLLAMALEEERRRGS